MSAICGVYGMGSFVGAPDQPAKPSRMMAIAQAVDFTPRVLVSVCERRQGSLYGVVGATIVLTLKDAEQLREAIGEAIAEAKVNHGVRS